MTINNWLGHDDETITFFRALLRPDCVVSMGMHIGAQCMPFEVSEAQMQRFFENGFVLPDALRNASMGRQIEFLAGRLCARDALERAGLPAFPPGRAEDRAPIWPKGATGSITHCGKIAAAVAASRNMYASIGLDIEAVQTEQAAAHLGPEIMTDAEASVARSSGIEPGVAFSAIFSAKETLYKTLYPIARRHFYFADAECLSLSMEKGTWTMRLRTSLTDKLRASTVYEGQIRMHARHVLTILALPASDDLCRQ